MWYGLGAPGISSCVIARFISSATASMISLVTALDGGPSTVVALGASLAPALATSRSGGLGSAGLGAALPAGASGPAGAGLGASRAPEVNRPSETNKVREARVKNR